MLTIKEETFEGTYPFAPQYYLNRSFEMHFVDEGQGEPVVMLHGVGIPEHAHSCFPLRNVSSG